MRCSPTGIPALPQALSGQGMLEAVSSNRKHSHLTAHDDNRLSWKCPGSWACNDGAAGPEGFMSLSGRV